ncbi:MAG TPA: DinB family protein [Pyrinomonadaceae bacterium]
MSEVARIGSQLKRAFEGEAWHGPSLMELLADVTAEQAAARPLAGAHSIWEIALHVAAWEGVARLRLEGQTALIPTEEDWPAVNDASEAAWREALTRLESGHRKLRAALRQLTDEDLEKIVAGQQYSLYFLLHGVIQHDLYHAGQIALLKKAVR